MPTSVLRPTMFGGGGGLMLFYYGLAAGGEAGVTRAIEILRTDVVRTLKLLGVESVAKLDRSYVDVPSEWLARVAR